jgi:hypothetical protein
MWTAVRPPDPEGQVVRRLVQGLVLGLAALVTAGCSSLPLSLDVTETRELPNCRVERVTYLSEGLRLVGWVITPKRPGPFPLLVWNHGSNVGPDRVERVTPTWTASPSCWESLTNSAWILFLPEGRGYGGSEGPRPLEAFTGPEAVVAFLHGRARDVNAGAALLEGRPEARKGCAVVMGPSHGGAVSILAAEGWRYRAVIAQATGMTYGNTRVGVSDMVQAMGRSHAPILLQHSVNDTLVSPEVSRTLAALGGQAGADVTHREYDVLRAFQGHYLFSIPLLSTAWKEDFESHRDRALRACP